MLPLSKNWTQKIESIKPEQILKVPCGILKLYHDPIYKDLRDAGFLNFVLTDKEGILLVYPIKDFRNTPIIVESMETLTHPNASWVTDIWIEEGTVYAHHWGCFVSRFDPSTMQLIGQKFTH